MDWLIVSIVLLAAALVAVGAVVVGTVTKNRMGINFRTPHCPQCGTTMPTFRKPGSLRQALWGGYTCASCGCESDKWGRRV